MCGYYNTIINNCDDSVNYESFNGNVYVILNDTANL